MADGTIPGLGATLDARGVHFALHSREAEAVELCLFDAENGRETARHRIKERHGDIWYDYLPGLRAGQAYGYRVYGPYRPEQGLRFNHHKLLIDPYALGLAGALMWDDAVFGYTPGHPLGDLSFDTRDSAPYVPKSVVGERPRFRGTPRPATPWHESIVYELHVKGYTQRHPGVPERLRGTASALAQPVVQDHLRALGVTAVELMPVQEFVSEVDLVRRGLRNYWGYNPLALFVPHRGYASDGGGEALARMVDAFHDSGIEVLLDVVFNHTAEGDETGPTVSFRGIDNRAYYMLEPEAPRRYLNFSGCGNTLKAAEPAVARLVVDCLRYWAETAGVDGFRFDLASVLLRDDEGWFDGGRDLVDRITRDPLLSQLKLIAEPWDATADGHKLGAFPAGWSEWNDRYRTVVRRFWAREGGVTGELATRISGSSDIFAPRDRPPSASVNYVTCHDGFTLHDLVSYRHKHNDANGEENRDGDGHSFSINCGTEGPSDDPEVLALRMREMRNRLATLLLSRGVPMLLAGDEISHTQFGNNNPYCQDNETTWLDWRRRGAAAQDLRDFVSGLIALRRSLPVLTEDRHAPMEAEAPAGAAPGYRLVWLTPEGREMTAADWHFPDAHVLVCLIASNRDSVRLLLVANALDGTIACRLPDLPEGGWRRAVDTASDTGFPEGVRQAPGEAASVPARSLVLFIAEAERSA